MTDTKAVRLCALVDYMEADHKALDKGDEATSDAIAEKVMYMGATEEELSEAADFHRRMMNS